MSTARKSLVWIWWTALTVALLLTGYFIAMTSIIPVLNYKIEIPQPKKGEKKAFQPDLTWKLSVEDSLRERTLSLFSREAFLLAKMDMTESDSVSLAVSLKDSAVYLVMQGVTIYSAKIHEYTVSNAFQKTDPFGLTRWLAKPFLVDTFYASVPKVPVLYKKAPRDTIEAMTQSALDTLKGDRGPVHFRLLLDRKIELCFQQAEPLERGFMADFREYKRQQSQMERKNIFSHLSKFEPIGFIPEIKIVLDKKACRVVYRAIPARSLVAIQLQF
jgi:hypothetical protein